VLPRSPLFYNKLIIFLYMFRALLCSKHVEEYNELITKQKFVHYVGPLLRLRFLKQFTLLYKSLIFVLLFFSLLLMFSFSYALFPKRLPTSRVTFVVCINVAFSPSKHWNLACCLYSTNFEYLFQNILYAAYVLNDPHVVCMVLCAFSELREAAINSSCPSDSLHEAAWLPLKEFS